jgi:DNA-binding GntR family transcriptional regulator
MLKLELKKDTENSREYVYRILRKNIMNLNLSPGDSINENELTNIFKMSRTPIHEAIIKLNSEMLIDIFPQSGTKISKIDIHILNEGVYVRNLIEPDLIKKLSTNMRTQDIQLMKENLKEQFEIANDGTDVNTFFTIDDKFHHFIYTFSYKENVWNYIKAVTTHYDRVRYMDAILGSGNLNNFYEEHYQIFNILQIGYSEDFDIDKFYTNHLNSYKKTLPELMKKNPDFFTN